MKPLSFSLLILQLGTSLILSLTTGRAVDSTPPPKLAFHAWAETPPMGWNSYDAFGSSVTEQEVLDNARTMKDLLLAHGWNTIVVDYRWYSPQARTTPLNGVLGEALTCDNYGRPVPAPNRFSSATPDAGFKALADRIHAMGLKFGIHVMRGLPAQSYQADTPIEGTHFTAKQASDGKCGCSWCKDNFNVLKSEAGQAWYDAEARCWAAWHLDFVKVDDLSKPYHKDEIEMIRHAIDACGRPIIFSTSPGKTPISQSSHVLSHANQWRISDDFWDNWHSLNHNFDLFALWQPYAGPGHWPDGDMIPFGRIGIRSIGGDRETHYTHDEEKTLISLWSLESSPLILGANLPDLKPDTLELLTNDAVLAVDQDPAGNAAKRVLQDNLVETWVKELKDQSYAFGIFNRGAAQAEVIIDWRKLSLPSDLSITDLWEKKSAGGTSKNLTVTVPRHGCVLYKVSK